MDKQILGPIGIIIILAGVGTILLPGNFSLISMIVFIVGGLLVTISALKEMW